MDSTGIEKRKTDSAPVNEKKSYEKACITEHEPLEEAVATVYYYYTY